MYARYVLRPANAESAKRLFETENRKTVVPLDSALGIDGIPFKMTISIMLDIAYWAIKLDSYQEAEDFFKRCHDIQISDDSIREVVNCIGKIVFKDDCLAAQKCKNDFEARRVSDIQFKKKGILYLQTDGAALNTRTRDQNDSSWRENKLGVAFSDDNIQYWKGKKGESMHRILKREYISLIGSAQDFKFYFLALALRNGYGSYEKTVIISDGATWIRNMKDELFPDAQHILDLFHLKENVYGFAKEIFKNDDAKYVPWAENMCRKLENGRWKEALKKLEPYKNMPAKPGIVNLYTYIYNNRDNIDYPAYKEAGMFVGSGAIESGNKTVLQKRLKLPGMRWNIDTAQYVVALRAKLESGLWDSYVVPLVINALTQKV